VSLTSNVKGSKKVFFPFVEPQCPVIRCQIFCEKYATDPRTGCQICECKGILTCITLIDEDCELYIKKLKCG